MMSVKQENSTTILRVTRYTTDSQILVWQYTTMKATLSFIHF